MRPPSWTAARRAGVLALAVGLLSSAAAPARFMRPDLDKVPVSRIIDNLEKQAKKDAKDVTARLNLARAHAMAYALKADSADVWKGKEDKGIWFGYTPKHVPFTVKPTTDKAKLKEANEHLKKAIARYQEVVRLKSDDLPARLGLAWAQEQAGDKAAAIKGYRGVIEDGWKKEKDLKRAPLGWQSVTAEAAGYLIPLLDKAKDKAEIATLDERVKALRKIPRPVTPIVVPLRDGLRIDDLVDAKARVAFDADGSGLRRRWTWVTPQAGWLVYDPHGTKKVTSALQLFGGVSFWMFWENGYQALAALDDDGDGRLTGKELAGLAVWVDANGDGVCDAGEVKTLAELGVVALSCRPDASGTPAGCAAFASKGVTFKGGKTRPTYDVILRPR